MILALKKKLRHYSMLNSSHSEMLCASIDTTVAKLLSLVDTVICLCGNGALLPGRSNIRVSGLAPLTS